MKKIILSIAAVAFTSASVLAQISNNGFENWTSMGTYSNPDNWETLNNYTAPASIYTATKGTPGNPGTSYLKLTSKTASTTVINGIAVYGKISPSTYQPISGLPFTGQPASFSGSWQHMIYGSSQGAIMVTLTKWNTTTNQRDIVATANQTLSGMAMSWANFSINLTYLSSIAPDSCMIVLKASGAAPTNNDYLWVDNLAFNGSVVGINNINNYVSNINTYPNPTSDNITIELYAQKVSTIKLQLVDLTGKLIKEINVGEIQGNYKHTISTTGISKGIYFLKVTANDAVETKKIIIQ